MLHRVCRHLWLQGREYQSLGLARRQGRLNLVNLLVVGGLARRALQLHFTAKVGRGLLDPGRDALPVFRIERLEDDRNRVRLLTACGRLRAVGGTAACGQGNCHRARQEHRHPSLCIHAVLLLCPWCLRAARSLRRAYLWTLQRAFFQCLIWFLLYLLAIWISIRGIYKPNFWSKPTISRTFLWENRRPAAAACAAFSAPSSEHLFLLGGRPRALWSH